MWLSVECGPLSTNITEATYDAAQYQEVGSNHGFYFTNYSSYSDCPVFTYSVLTAGSTIGSETLHTSFPLAANVSVTGQTLSTVSSLMIIKPADGTVI